MANVGVIDVQINADMTAFNASMDRMRRSLRGLGTNMTGLGRNVRRTNEGISRSFLNMRDIVGGLAIRDILIKIKDLASGGMRLAITYESSLQRINYLFGENAKAMTKWADNNATAFNMSREEAMRYGAIYGNLLQGTFSDGKELMTRTKDLLKASAIISSGTGRSMEDVMMRLRSGLMGEVDAVEDLGVSVFVSTMEQSKAFAELAGGKKWKQLGFQLQQQIRLMSILEQTSTKFGDVVYKNTGSAVIKLSSLFSDIKLNIGQAFLPLLNVVIPILQRFAEALKIATAQVVEFMNMIFGIKQTTGSVKKAATAQSKLGEAIKDAGKDAKNSVADFDEVHQIQEALGTSAESNIAIPSVSNGGTQTEGIIGEAALGRTIYFEDLLWRIREALLPIREAIKTLNTALEPLSKEIGIGFSNFYNDFIKPIGIWTLGEGFPKLITLVADTVTKIDLSKVNKSLKGLYKSITPFAKVVGEGLLWFYDNVLSPIAVYMVNELVPKFLDLITGSIGLLDNMIIPFKPAGLWLLYDFLYPLGNWTGGIVAIALDKITAALTKVSDWADKHKKSIEMITNLVLLFFAAWTIVEILSFLGTVGRVKTALKTMAKLIWAHTGALVVNWIVARQLALLRSGLFLTSLLNGTLAVLNNTKVWIINTAAMVWAKVKLISLIAFTKLATGATWLLNAALAMNPYVLIGVAILAFVGIMFYLWKTNDKFKDAIIGVWNAISDGVTYVVNGLASVLETIFYNIAKGIIWVLDKIIGEINKIIEMQNKINPLFHLDLLNRLEFKPKDPYVPIKNSLKKVQEETKKAVSATNDLADSQKKLNELSEKQEGLVADKSLMEKIRVGVANSTGFNTKVPIDTKATTDNINEGDKISELLSTFEQREIPTTTEEDKTVALDIDGSTFARLIIPLINKEKQRTGTKMITSVI